MDKLITYTNHRGESLELGPGSIYHYGKHTFCDSARGYDIDNGRAGSLRREPREHELPVGIEAPDGPAGLAARERLRAVLAADTDAGAAGSVEIGGWRMRAKPVRVECDKWWLDDRLLEVDVTLLAEDPAWRRERTRSFVPDRAPAASGAQPDYPIGFPFDYAPNPPLRRLDVDAEGPCAWRLLVYGPATDPYVLIGANRYQASVGVPEGGVLIADSRDWSIVVRDSDGNEQNAFAARIRGKEGSGEYMWRPIDPGAQPVSWSNAFGWDITLYEERDAAPCG